MDFSLQRALFVLAATVIAVDLVWAAFGHFQIDTIAYLRLGLMGLALMGAGLGYQKFRNEPQLAAMLLGASFLCLFSSGASVLNYFLLTVAGPRIDDLLLSADRAMGFDWYRMMIAMAHYPVLNAVFFRVYNTVLPQIALVLVFLAWTNQVERTYRFCLSLGVGALIAIFIWALAPSLGAKSMYVLPPDVAQRLTLSVTTEYGKALVMLLHNGPGYITPSDLRGLIAFPSYHGVLALIVTWYAWNLRWIRWPAIGLNAVVLVSTPVQGGHHLIDVIAAFPVTMLALWLARDRDFLALVAGMRGKKRVVVNNPPIFTIPEVPNPAFRAVSAQMRAPSPSGD